MSSGQEEEASSSPIQNKTNKTDELVYWLKLHENQSSVNGYLRLSTIS
jgi:hypothetical protein